ncbi:unnamed protein product [Oreochromis niloticus]|nr:unnamed protein product [Mustela putorius furo]
MNVKASNTVYSNVSEIQTSQSYMTGPPHSGVKKISCRYTAVFLGLLCLFLLAGLLTLVFLCKSELDQEQTSYKELEDKLNQLKDSYNDLAKVREQLQQKLEITRTNKLPKDKCPLWVSFGPSCYYISSEVKTWEESRKDCQRRNSDLVIINSDEEQKFIMSLGKRVWLGLTDQDEENVWTWVDGTTLAKSYWYHPQPDNGGDEHIEEDCAELLNYNNDLLLTWNDISCLKTNHWICETVS